jgi:hypothetical protein
MCLTMAQHHFEPLESLNRSLQSAKAAAVGMLESAKAVRSQLQRMREAAEFDKILNSVESKIVKDQSIASQRAISASRT